MIVGTTRATDTHLSARQPGMKDVALRAGVSHQTVSRVINHHPNVSASTRERVEAAIKELGYLRNMTARALVTRRSRTIGVVTFGSFQYGPVRAMLSIEQAARQADLHVNLTTVDDENAVDDVIHRLLGRAVEGVILVAPQQFSVGIARRLREYIPAVVVGTEVSEDINSASIDQALGAQMATEHLLGLGHRDIAHITGPMDWHDAQARAAGWARAMQAAGLTPRPMIAGDWSPECGYQIGCSFERRDLPTALFVANDQMAVGVMRAFHERAIAVPDRVSVVGFDDIDLCAFLWPPLTTVRQDFATLGTRAVELLLELMSGAPTASVLVPPALMVRASTASVAGACSTATSPASVARKPRPLTSRRGPKR